MLFACASKADARLEIRPDVGDPFNCYVISPCRAEYTIVSDNLFQIPSGEYRAVSPRRWAFPSRSSRQPKRRTSAGSRWPTSTRGSMSTSDTLRMPSH